MQFPSLTTIAPNALRATALALALLGCADDDDESGSIDAGPEINDAGSTDSGGSPDTGASDAATTDGGPQTDAGATDGGPGADGGLDAGGDAGATDAGGDAGATDAGTVDSSASAAIPTFNGCAEADYTDRSASGADREIEIAPSGELVYAPKCMIIAVGQTVSWDGSLTAHPLAPGNAASAAAGSASSPIQATSTGGSVEFTFPAAGTYPYHCTVHSSGAGLGMAGVVHVR